MIRLVFRVILLCALLAPFPVGRVVHATGDAHDCRLVARLFGKEICAEAIERELPVDAILAETGVDGPANSPEKNAARAIALRALVWSKAMEKKYGAAAVAPTEAEIDDFLKKFTALTEERYQTDKKSAALLRHYLDNNKYGEPHKTKINQLIQSVDMSILFYEKKQEHQRAIPSYFSFVSGEAEKKLVTQMLRRWKEDKVLFENYGGRLAEISGRLAPIDAYKKFYGYILADGGLKIEDDRFADLFADLGKEGWYKILSEDDPLYKNYFTDPSWQFRMAEDEDRLVTLENWLKNLPVSEGGK